MIEVATLAVCCLILIIVALYPVYTRLMIGIMANQLDEKAPASAVSFDAIRRDVVELVGQLETTTKLLAAVSNGRSKAGDEARELVARIKHEYGISSPE